MWGSMKKLCKLAVLILSLHANHTHKPREM